MRNELMNFMIREKLWENKKLASCSRDARLTFLGILSVCVDFGWSPYLHQSFPSLKNRIYPFDDIPIAVFDRWIDELEKAGFIMIHREGFVEDDEMFLFILDLDYYNLLVDLRG